MSLHFQQYLTEGSDELYVDPNINLNILEAEYDLMNMALECDREIFMEGCKEDYYEIACRYGMVNESYNVINEGALEDLFSRGKEFISKAYNKLKELIMSVINKMRMLCTKDGATLVNKYSKQAHENFRLKNMENVRFKWRGENNEQPKISSQLESTAKDISDYTQILKNVANTTNGVYLTRLDNLSGTKVAGGYRVYTVPDAASSKDSDFESNTAGKIELPNNKISSSKSMDDINKKYKPYDADEIREIKDELCGKVATSLNDFNSLKEDYFEYRLKDEEELEGTEFPLHEAENILKDYKKMTRDLEKEQKQCDKTYKNIRKEYEKIEKDMIKALREKDALLTKLIAQKVSAKHIQYINTMTLVASKFYSLEFEVLKTRYRYAKTGFIKCATFAGKSYNESTVLIDEFVAYELNV